MKPKYLLLLSVLAGLAAVLLAQVQLRQEKGSPVVVFRATRALQAGAALGGNVETVTLPGDNLFPNILKEAPTGEMAAFVAETPLVEAIDAGEIVLFRHLESMVDPGIPARIPTGMKAVSIEVDEVTSVSYLVQPGDVVDVLAALPQSDRPPPGLTPDAENPEVPLRTRPLLQAVPVLAVGLRFRRTSPRTRDSFGAVTLLVSMEEAQKLTYVRDVLQSPMTLILRNPQESGRQESVEPLSVDSAQFDGIGN